MASSPSSERASCRDVVLGEPAQPDAEQRAVALELGQRAGQRAAPPEFGVAVGAEDEQRARRGRSAAGSSPAAACPRSAQCRSSMTSSRPRSSLSDASTASKRRWRAPLPVSSPGCRTSTAPSKRSTSANGSKAASGSSQQRPAQHARAGLEDLAREAMRQARLAHAGLARDQDDRGGFGAARRRPRPREDARARVARPTNAVSCSRARSAAARRTSGGRRSVSSSGAGLARRRDRQRRAQPLGEALARDQRRGSVTRSREALDQAPVGLLRERVERHLLARQADRLDRVARRRGERFEGLGEPLAVGPAGLVRPVVVEAVEDRGGTRLAARPRGRRDGVPRRTGARRRPPVAVERDRVARWRRCARRPGRARAAARSMPPAGSCGRSRPGRRARSGRRAGRVRAGLG